MGVRTEPATGTRIYYIIDMRVKGRGNPGTFEVVIIEVIEVGRKTRKGGATPTSNPQPQSQPQDPTPQRDRRIMHHAKGQSPGAIGAGQVWGGWKRGEKALKIPEEEL